MSLYLILNITSFIIPFLYSFESRMKYIKRWKAVFTSIAMTAVFFIAWDIIFTKIGVWSFNPRYHSGLEFFGLPIEEWLFFICIPYASIFIHFAFQYFYPKVTLTDKTVKKIYWILLIILLPTTMLNYDKLYTSINYSVFLLVLTYTFFKVTKVLNTFFISFLIILVPFAIVNGILTGSFIDEPVVIYNNAENLGIRLGTIPIEDVGYAFTMLLMSLVLITKIEKITNGLDRFF
ncbi:lycopene cyclase domain-containing protein [Flavobacterium cellulosilyticum]|uniref:Lycopene cyclase domain-containing protein n=1 Tax=Flavobacterium cellulosilyticum TaxID=2541731 RepID=A0A4R5CFY0_9FLAO|nr:lycopene cyclase domain-containing protein [Flavobacterium cellulosilyticum]TDD97330.1 lycopene cyclase domain-containing protein [Flavobacterium cellulosilyticum]